MRFEKVRWGAIKHAKRTYLGKDHPSSDEEMEDSLLAVKPKRKVAGTDKKYTTISMSGMMSQVMDGQAEVREGQQSLEDRVGRLEGKVDKLIKAINDQGRKNKYTSSSDDDGDMKDMNEGR